MLLDEESIIPTELCSKGTAEPVTVTVVCTELDAALLSALALTATDVATDIVIEFMTGGPKDCGPPYTPPGPGCCGTQVDAQPSSVIVV